MKRSVHAQALQSHYNFTPAAPALPPWTLQLISVILFLQLFAFFFLLSASLSFFLLFFAQTDEKFRSLLEEVFASQNDRRITFLLRFKEYLFKNFGVSGIGLILTPVKDLGAYFEVLLMLFLLLNYHLIQMEHFFFIIFIQ